MCLRHYQKYDSSVKKYIKSDHACNFIKEGTKSIENNMKYLCHYYFIDVTTFNFLGDTIVKGANHRLKRGDVIVSKNMNIDISAITQI